MSDTVEKLQSELAGLKTRYLSSLGSNETRDEEFARLEAEICRRFHAIGVPPSYPDGYLDGDQPVRTDK